MEQIATEIRDAARRLLSEGEVDLVIGYAKGTLPLTSRPCFVDSADGVDRLTWDSFCLNNLAVYLPRYFQKDPRPPRGTPPPPPRIGVVVKGCDLHSVLGLISEHQIPRENVVIVGVCCAGMIDAAKAAAAVNGQAIASGQEDADGKNLQVTTLGGESKSLDKAALLADACLECERAKPKGADMVVVGAVQSASSARFAAVAGQESKSLQERWEYFTQELSKCIRCYACRQACPNCYCKTCFIEQGKPRWVGATSELSDVMGFHIGRILHQAGRCVGCDACARACPMNVDLRSLTQKLVKDVEEMFGFVPGVSTGDLPLYTFSEDDSQSFVVEP